MAAAELGALADLLSEAVSSGSVDKMASAVKTVEAAEKGDKARPSRSRGEGGRGAAAGGDGDGDDAASAKAEDGIEWRTNWEPTTLLPDSLDAKSLAQDELAEAARALARSEEGFRRRKAVAAHAAIPEQEITPEVKRDFRILRLRGVMDPKRFYKGTDEAKIPKRFQWGTIVEGPTEYFSSRMTKGERKQTFTEEIMSDDAIKTYRKRKFKDIQTEAQKHVARKGKQPKRNQRKRTSHRGYKG